MPLPLPDLDTRSWAELVQEGQALIPRHAPSWTDHNVHDPGITLIELFAWLVEQDIYRVNRVPDRHRLKFLSLIGFAPHPPKAAKTVLALSPPSSTPTLPISSGFEFEGNDPDGEVIPFRTLRDLTVTVVTLDALQVGEQDANGAVTIVDRTRPWRAHLPVAILGLNPQPGAALYLGFSDLPTGTPIAFAFHFDGPGHDEAERTRIMDEEKARLLACRAVLPDIPCDPPPAPAPTVKTVPPHHSARIVWEVSTGTGPLDWTTLTAVSDLARPPVGGVMDDTRSLTLDGIVEMNLPATMVKTTVGSVVTDLFYVRARLVKGAYDSPPMLIGIVPNGVEVEQAIPAWQTFAIAPGVVVGGTAPEPPSPAPEFPMIPTAPLGVTFDNAGVIQALNFGAAPNQPEIGVLDFAAPSATDPGHVTLEMVFAGFGTGWPGQRVVLRDAPVDVASLRLYSHDGNAWQEWLLRLDLDASTRTDFHFVLDTMRGEIAFGDGEQSRVVPKDAAILAIHRTTRGKAGTVKAGVVTRASASPHNATLGAQWPPALGGIDQLSSFTTNVWNIRDGNDAEELTHAAGRAVETLHAHERLLNLCAATACSSLDQIDRARVEALSGPTRAMNLLDIERLALDVPGTSVARVRAWANTHPAYPCLNAPGIVSVVVVPDMPVSRPEPSAGLLGAIAQFLDRRRTIATRLEVVAPRYLEVSVHGRVRARTYADPVDVQARIYDALNTFFDARHGGPAGLGWPFGRDVYRSEVLQVIDGVAGVDHVIELSLSADGGEPQCGNLSLCPSWLVTPLLYQIEVVRTWTSDEPGTQAIVRPVCKPDQPPE
jgi:Baseplate J-like protein